MSGVVTRRDEGELLLVGTATHRLVVVGDSTAGRASVIEMGLEPDWTGLPRHVHNAVDHLLVVFNGAMNVVIDGERHVLTTGDVGWIPSGSTHELSTGQQPCSLLRIDTPQSLDGCVRDLAAAHLRGAGSDPAVLDDVLARHGTHRV